MLDRAGLAGPDGPTHHGVFDLGYLRVFPNMVVMAPGDEHDLPQMLDFALRARRPVCDSLSQGHAAERSTATATPVEFGKSEVLSWGDDGMIVCLRHAAARLPRRRPRCCATKASTSA